MKAGAYRQPGLSSVSAAEIAEADNASDAHISAVTAVNAFIIINRSKIAYQRNSIHRTFTDTGVACNAARITDPADKRTGIVVVAAHNGTAHVSDH